MKKENLKNTILKRSESEGFHFIDSGSGAGMTTREVNGRNESGRSMTEMLGVLAVMGVLSVGGISGYRYAINKHRANDTIYEVKYRAVNRSGGLGINNLNGTTSVGYPILEATLAPGFFHIDVQNIPNRVCHFILSANFKMPAAIYANNVRYKDNTSICADSNTLSFEFADNLSADAEPPTRHCTQNTDCASACELCQNGLCKSECPSGQECARRYGWDNNTWGYEHKSLQCCATENIVNGACCRSVTYDENGEKLCCKDTNQTGCCPTGEFFSGDRCYSCDEPGLVNTWKIPFCTACPDRLTIGERGCATECPDPAQTVWNGRCLCPDDKPVLSDQGICQPCGTRGVYAVNFVGMLKLDKAPNGDTLPGFCGDLRSGGGYVNPCLEGETGFSTYGTQVKLKNGDIVTVNDSYGKCFACSELDVASLKYKAQCERCGGTWKGETWFKGSCAPPEE